jgi:diguanylate cyclase (GGDEF)-like protein/PAS domain S-box-containing protein
LVLVPSSAVLIVAAGIPLILVVISWTRRSTPASIPFNLLMLAVMFWLFFGGLDNAAVDLNNKITFAKFEYLGIPYTAPLVLVFIGAYVRREKWFTRWRLALIFAVPFAASILAFTNEYHHLIWTYIYLSADDPSIAVYEHGAGFWLMLVEVYAALIVAAAWLIQAIIRYPVVYRQQTVKLLIGMVFPVLGNFISLAGLSPVRGLDLTPFGFVISGFVYTWVLFRYHMLRLVPVAREALIENMSDAVLVLDDQNRVVAINPAACRLFGLEENQTVGLPMSQISPLIAGYRGSHEIQEEIALDKEKPVYMDLRVTPLRNWRSRLTGWLVVLHDITVRKQALLEVERLYKAGQRRVQELNAVRAITMDLAGKFELPELLQNILTRAQELLEVTAGELALYDPQQNDLELIVSQGLGPNHAGQRQSMGEGVMGAIALTRQPLIVEDYSAWEGRMPEYADIDGQFTSLGVPLMAGDELLGVIMLGDIKSNRIFSQDELNLLKLFAQEAALAIRNARLFEQMKSLAAHDALTGLYNRGHFFRLAAIEVERAARYNKPLAAIMLDIDKFKRVNDSYGHAAGDQVLQAVTHLCIESIRMVDIIGRYGGEEFAIILPEADLEQARIVAERLCAAIACTPYATGHGTVNLSACLGVAVLNPEQVNLDVLLDQADQALYLAKQQGNQVRVYQP